MTALRAPADPRPSALAGMVTPLLAALAVLALAELLILRTFTRTAIHIPAGSGLQGAYDALAFLGRYAYFTAVPLLVAGVPLAGAHLWRSGDVAGRVAAAGGFGFLAVAAALAITGPTSNPVFDAATIAIVFMLAVTVAATREHRRAVPMALFGVAFGLGSLHTSLQVAGYESFVARHGESLLLGAEVAALTFALSVPTLTGGRWSRGAWLIAAVCAVVAYGAFQAGGGSTARILLLWNGGLQGSLPVVLYAAAAGVLGSTAYRLARTGDHITLIALALLVAGGIGLHNTYQTGLVVMGLLCIHLAASPARTLVAGAEPGMPAARIPDASDCV